MAESAMQTAAPAKRGFLKELIKQWRAQDAHGAVAAGDLEHTAVVDRSRSESMQDGHSRQAIRVRSGVRHARVGNRVVRILGRLQFRSSRKAGVRLRAAFQSSPPYAGCNSLFSSFFSTTGPCVSTVGGGGASPMRLE